MASLFERAQKRLESERNQCVSEDMAMLSDCPDGIAPETWNLIKENGHLATVRLNEILNSQRFHRLSATAQAKLIDLAQSRAFGRPIAQKISNKHLVITDETANALRSQASRTSLPEYRLTRSTRAATGPQATYPLGSDPESLDHA